MTSFINFQPGEIITGRRNITPISLGKHTICDKNGKRIRKTLYRLPEVNLRLPFLRGLLRKRFMVFFNKDKANNDFINELNISKNGYIIDYVKVILMDDYKPEIYGKNWRFRIHSLDMFQSTGEIVNDCRKMPFSIQRHALTILEENSFDNGYIKTDRKNILNDYLFYRRTNFKIYSDDLYRVYSVLNAIGKQCRNCSQKLHKTNVTLVDLLAKDINFDRIKQHVVVRESLNSDSGEKRRNYLLAIFPVGYICADCNSLNILYSLNPEKLIFSSLCVGQLEDFHR